MKVIGLTGGIASGKSAAATMLRRRGALVIDADQIARDITKVGMPVYEAIVQHFGEVILNRDDTINRKTLGKLVFEHPSKLRLLNRITHSPIIVEIKTKLRELESRVPSEQVVVIDAPLLIESGLANIVDLVVVVTTSEERQLERLEEKGFARSEAEDRIKAQMPSDERRALADFVLENSGTLDELETKVQELWDSIM